MTCDEYAFPHHRSPSEIRNVEFSHRIRGVDEFEVSEYLDLLADQVQAMTREMTRLRAECQRLESENASLRSDNERLVAPVSAHDVTPHAASLILHAQQMADALVEEAVRRSREMLAVARAEKRAMLRNAEEAAAALMREARDAPNVTRLAPRSWQLDNNAAV